MPDNNNNTNKQRRQVPIDSTYGHLQPQSLDIERVVLGALMIDKDAFSIVSEIIRPETFYEPRNQKIFHAIRTLNMEEKPVDIMTVAEQLRREGTLDEVGANAFDETLDIDLVMQKAEGELFEISQKNMRQDYTQIDPVISQAVDILQKASASSGGLTGIPTGYGKLDDMTSGWQKSDLVIIAGRPAMGKTSFALSLAKNIAVDYREPIAFFSLEMNNVQLVNRLISNVCEITGNKILNGQLSPDEWERLDKNIRRLMGAPIYIDDTPGLSIFELRTKARRLVREKGVKIIMIDYLQLMNANGMRFGNRQEEVSTISRSLKGLAKELDIPILALSQLNRTVENREGIDGKRPQLSDLRESGAIEQDADMVLFVHRPEYYHIFRDENNNDLRGKAQIIIAKHRKGATGDVLLTFRGEYTRFQNPDDGFIPPSPSSGGEIMGSKINGENDEPFAPPPVEPISF